MIEATLYRESDDGKQTIGTLVIQGVELKTLELPWRDNKKQVSCIPSGIYICKPRTSEKYGRHFHALDVPNRTFILIHAGNYHTHTLGCILVGLSRVDINADGLADVTSSRKALDKLLSIAPDGFKLNIRAT
jgi:hypothetical protein